MTKLVMVVIAMSLIAGIACASGTLGVTNTLGGDTCIDVYMNRSLENHWGAFGYLSVSRNWSEAYVGPAYSFTPNFGLEIGYGVESGQPGRWGGDVWACQGKVSAVYLFEAGGSGAWHKLKLLYSATPRLTAGLVEKSGDGFGATASYKLVGCTSLVLTAYESGTSQAGVSIGF
jgi:hypothetical protein